jgi:hypothetical protein
LESAYRYRFRESQSVAGIGHPLRGRALGVSFHVQWNFQWKIRVDQMEPDYFTLPVIQSHIDNIEIHDTV